MDPMYATLERTTRFVWNHLLSIIAISFAWFLAAIPLVTIGPATVGAYRAVLSLRDDETVGIDREAVLETVREQFLHATLLAFVPFALFVVAVNYGLAYLASASVSAGLLALGCAYASLYAGLVAMPTLLGLATGKSAPAAVVDGYRWTAHHAVGAVAVAVVTTVLFVVSSLLTVAVALLFAGIACTLHIEFVAGVGDFDLETDRVEHDEHSSEPVDSRPISEVTKP
ncbi:hypothetical protein G6M89_01910 [Natronolimnobius sp. AArcel1]|nr:hypothetical protein [Natronolimnobius sp. AArcel1]